MRGRKSGKLLKVPIDPPFEWLHGAERDAAVTSYTRIEPTARTLLASADDMSKIVDNMLAILYINFVNDF